MDLKVGDDGEKSRLSADELARLGRYRHPRERQRFLSGRLQLRQILARYMNCGAASIRFGYNQKGKPLIKAPRMDIQFNLSHSADIALLAISRGMSVGIDLEPIRIRQSYRRMAQRVFGPQTLMHLEGLDEAAFAEAFLNQWTLFEARVKALGAGVFDYPAAITSLPAQSFTPIPGWIAAVAGDGPLPDIKSWVTLTPG